MIIKNDKKRISIVLGLILISALIFLSFNLHKTNLDVTAKNISNNTNILSMNSESEEIPMLYSKYIKTEGSIDDELISYLDLKLQCIPENILSLYFNQGGSILLTDKDISKTYYSDYDFGNIIGLHDARKNIVFISNSKYAIDNALIHEFGHVLDSISGWDSMNEYFLNVFNQEKDSFKVKSVDNHYKLNEREFFAEVFQEYILNPDTCKSSAPKAFEFVDKKIKNLK